MSRTEGRVQRAIRSAFEQKPDARYTTEELCRLAYPGVKIEKKHRVAVRRAAQGLREKRGLTIQAARAREIVYSVPNSDEPVPEKIRHTYGPDELAAK